MATFLTSDAPFVLYEYLKEKIGLSWSEDLRVIGRIEDMKLTGVVGFNNYTGTSCQMHFAGEKVGWLTRQVIRESFRYAFETLGCVVVYASVPSGCQTALEIDRRLGFKDLAYLKGAHPDGGIYLLEMYKEQCRWIKQGDMYGRKVLAKCA